MMLDRKYYLRRERDHRAAAAAAVNDTARRAHLALAERYAAKLEDSRPSTAVVPEMMLA